jgi:hypothetical protein
MQTWKYTAVSDAKKNKLGNSWIAGYSQTVYNKKVADWWRFGQ